MVPGKSKISHPEYESFVVSTSVENLIRRDLPVQGKKDFKIL